MALNSSSYSSLHPTFILQKVEIEHERSGISTVYMTTYYSVLWQPKLQQMKGWNRAIETLYLLQAWEFVANKIILKNFGGHLSFWNTKGIIILNTYT
jgi:hypothetical protein